VGEDRIVCFNVGDSRVYLHSETELIQLSHDDVPLGTGPRSNRPSHQITQSLGGRTVRTPIHPHVSTGPALNFEDTLLICSDGLTDMVSQPLVNSTIARERDLERCARTLLGLALDGGGRDNISIIIARKSLG
jgi:protein phosphatase